jgi:hypothetical protein
LIEEVRNTKRKDLPKMKVDYCVDENGLKVKLIDSKEEFAFIIEGKNVH